MINNRTQRRKDAEIIFLGTDSTALNKFKDTDYPSASPRLCVPNKNQISEPLSLCGEFNIISASLRLCVPNKQSVGSVPKKIK